MSDDNETITLLYTQFANGKINGHQFAAALAIEHAKELDVLKISISNLDRELKQSVNNCDALRAKLEIAMEAFEKLLSSSFYQPDAQDVADEALRKIKE